MIFVMMENINFPGNLGFPPRKQLHLLPVRDEVLQVHALPRRSPEQERARTARGRGGSSGKDKVSPRYSPRALSIDTLLHSPLCGHSISAGTRLEQEHPFIQNEAHMTTIHFLPKRPDLDWLKAV